MIKGFVVVTSWNSHIGVWLKPIVMVFLIRTDIGISDLSDHR